MKINRILVIGLGNHAKRIHVPVIVSLGNAKLVAIVELKSEQHLVEKYLNDIDCKPEIFYINNKEDIDFKNLTVFAKEQNINSVVISTEPESHTLYAKWALKNGFSVLMDKPIHAEPNAANNKESAKKIHSEYSSLLKAYFKNKKQFPYLACEVLAQRRYHPAYKLIKKTIDEVYELTNCPITYYYAFHNDGQWRMPEELSSIDYHGFNRGYGKASHSGYHFFDLLNWFTQNFRDEKNIDSIKTFSTANFPDNYLAQINSSVLKKALKGNVPSNTVDLNKYGEIDVMSNIRLCSKQNTITHAQIDLLHSGISSRYWIDIEGRNLYKNNGRVRHEEHYISIGPFASILLTSWQSKPFSSEQINSKEIFKSGHEFNLDITIFRNSDLIGGKSVETITLNDIYKPTMKDYSRGHQEDARREAIEEFNKLVLSGRNEGSSTLESHFLSSQIMSSVYESISEKRTVTNKLKSRS
jgi:hypothetical protein